MALDIDKITKLLGEGAKINLDKDTINVKKDDMSFKGPVSLFAMKPTEDGSRGYQNITTPRGTVGADGLISSHPSTRNIVDSGSLADRFLGPSAASNFPGDELSAEVPAEAPTNIDRNEMIAYFLGNLGKTLDPKGIGGGLGEATTKWIEASRKERAATSLQKTKSEALIEASKERKAAGIEDFKTKERFKTASQGPKYFTGKTWYTDVDDYIASDAAQDMLLSKDIFPGSPGYDRAVSQLKEDFIVSEIEAQGGVIDYDNSRVEGSTFVWKVKWANGTTSEVRYGN